MDESTTTLTRRGVPERAPARRRGRPRKLSRERIIAAALELLDREGAEALTMRRLGAELGVEAMSLYRHVASRAELLDGVAALLAAEIAPQERPADWADALRAFAGEVRALARRHPAAFTLVGIRVLGGARRAGAGRGRPREPAGRRLHARPAIAAYRLVTAYTRGYALSEIAGFAVEAALRRGPAGDPLARRRLASEPSDAGFRAGLETIIGGLRRARAVSESSPARRRSTCCSTARPRRDRRRRRAQPGWRWRRRGQAVLERALDARVERVQPVQRERLDAREAPAGRGVGAVVAEHAVLEREQAPLVEHARGALARSAAGRSGRGRAGGPPRCARSSRAVGELARLADVVDDRRAEQQVAVQARVPERELLGERRHGDGVLEQAAEVGVVAGARARRAPPRGAQRRVAEQRARAGAGSRARRPRARGARGSRRARRGRGRRPAGTPPGRCSPRRRRARSGRARAGSARGSARRAPTTRTSSPRSKRPPWRSASRNSRAGSAALRSRSSTAR